MARRPASIVVGSMLVALVLVSPTSALAVAPEPLCSYFVGIDPSNQVKETGATASVTVTVNTCGETDWVAYFIVSGPHPFSKVILGTQNFAHAYVGISAGVDEMVVQAHRVGEVPLQAAAQVQWVSDEVWTPSVTYDNSGACVWAGQATCSSTIPGGLLPNSDYSLESVEGSIQGTAGQYTCFSQPATIVGSQGSEEISGTPGDDVIVSLGGNDNISARGGIDRVCAGAGDDQIRGDSDNDLLMGGPGFDYMHGGQGGDHLEGNGDNDVLLGAEVADGLLGGQGSDSLFDGGGLDNLSGGNGGDVAHLCRGDGSPDTLYQIEYLNKTTTCD